MENDFVTFMMRDNDCKICKRENEKWSGVELEFTHEGLRIVVEVCHHARSPYSVARCIIEDNYGELTHRGITKSAIMYRLHSYSWTHLDDEYSRCSTCSDCYHRTIDRQMISGWFFSTMSTMAVDEDIRIDWVSYVFDFLENIGKLPKAGSRFCKNCLHVASNDFKRVFEKEIRKWHELQQLQKNERESVLKVKELLVRAKRALRMTEGRQDALRLLKTEFEQAATSHK